MPYAIIVLHHFELAYLLHCTMLLSAHVSSYTLDHVESELKEPTEYAQSEDLTNLVLDQGKPQCIPPHSLTFIFESLLYVEFICALSYRNCVGTIVVL
jgi:hypothetical protein